MKVGVEFVLNIWNFAPYLPLTSRIWMRFGETNRKEDRPQIFETCISERWGLDFRRVSFHLGAWVTKLCVIVFFCFSLTSPRMKVILKININVVSINF